MRVLLATALLFALLAGAAQAKTYCVSDPACPAGGIPRTTLFDAVDGAGGSDANADADVIRIGPGTFNTPPVATTEVVDIVGAGMGRTELRASSSGISALRGSASSVSDLAILLPANMSEGVRMHDGADATRVKVSSADDDFGNNSGFVAEDTGSVLTSVQTDLAPQPFGSAAKFFDEGTVRDSTLIGGIGVSPGAPGTTTVTRSTIRATVPLRVFGANLSANNSVLTAHPRSTATFSAGIDVTNSSDNGGEPSSFSGDHLTLVGPGSGTGLRAASNTSAASGNVTATLRNSILSGVFTSIRRNGDGATEQANATVSYSSYNGGTVSDDPGFGTLTIGPGNVTTNPDPRFVDAGAGDFRLRYDSPLRDLGDPAPPVLLVDRNGLARARDSDGNGSVRRDIGAHEYQRLPPKPAFTAPSVLFGAATPFDGRGSSDPDGDPLTAFTWAFGDGTGATGATTSHRYRSPGRRQARLTARDATGLTASVQRFVTVALRPGACANVQTGGAAADTLTGFAGGDRLRGLAGSDALRGVGGDDCLDGGADDDRLAGDDGNDRVSGDAGSDELDGAAGDDRLAAGEGDDRGSGGDGADRLDGAGGRDRLNGGAGRDRLEGGAAADRLGGGRAADRLSGGKGNDRLGGDSGNDRLAGSSGRDRLSGGSGRDRLAGGAGRDRLIGGSGGDRLRAEGRDRVSAGSGNDRISAANGKPDRISCGRGRRDRVTADRFDRLRGCERVRRRRR